MKHLLTLLGLFVLPLLLWLFHRVPLGKFAPTVLGLILGSKPVRYEIRVRRNGGEIAELMSDREQDA